MKQDAGLTENELGLRTRWLLATGGGKRCEVAEVFDFFIMLASWGAGQQVGIRWAVLECGRGRVKQCAMLRKEVLSIHVRLLLARGVGKRNRMTELFDLGGGVCLLSR